MRGSSGFYAWTTIVYNVYSIALGHNALSWSLLPSICWRHTNVLCVEDFWCWWPWWNQTQAGGLHQWCQSLDAAQELALNDNKMKILVFHAKHQPAPSMDCLQVVSTYLKPTDHARNIGVILDSNRSSKCVNLLFTQLDQFRELESFSVWKVPRLWCMLLRLLS